MTDIVVHPGSGALAEDISTFKSSFVTGSLSVGDEAEHGLTLFSAIAHFDDITNIDTEIILHQLSSYTIVLSCTSTKPTGIDATCCDDTNLTLLID